MPIHLLRWRRFNAVMDLGAQQVVPDVALVTPGGDAVSRARLIDRSERLAGLLAQHGMRRGDAVAVLGRDDPAVFETMFAARRLGLRLLPVDPTSSLEEAAYVVNHSGARVLIAGQDAAARAEELVLLTPDVEVRYAVGSDVPGHRSLRRARTVPPLEGVAAPGVRLLHYSAAVVGRPTPCELPDPISEPDGRDQMARILGGHPVGPGSVLLSPAPLLDPVGAYLSMSTLSSGGRVVGVVVPSAEELLAAVARHRASILHLTPPATTALLKCGPDVWHSADLAHLRLVVVTVPGVPAGAASALVARLGDAVRQVCHVAGTGVVAAMSAAEIRRRPEAVGRVGEDVVVLADGALVPPGIVGRAHRLVQGEPAALRLHERGFLDEDRYLHLVDSPEGAAAATSARAGARQVERVLVLHPEVADVAVITAREGGGRDVLAVVEPAAGADAGRVLEARLLQHLMRELPMLSGRVRVVFRPQLPRTASGKLDRRRLPALAEPEPIA